ncbi:MAG: di-trans,poly-cis-decaprenylcistransferase [Parachlamydia sp.]|nr:di-trans,poly-cis-decaprenylcistransferase [Parachlamydia sp.]
MYFTEDQLAAIDLNRLPKHIAIIPDGNRRWAKKQASSASQGHHQGAQTLADIVKACKELGVRTMTLYLFSTENWQRPAEEVKAFLWLLETFLQQQIPTMLEGGVRFHTIGNLSRLPESTSEVVQKIKEDTQHGDQFDLIAAINYGGRDEIARACQRMLAEHAKGGLKSEEITEERVAQYLDTAPWGDPDLLIRTSGESRVSNFLLWQIAYTELYITDVLWPDFSPQHLLEALRHFQARDRRKGE